MLVKVVVDFFIFIFFFYCRFIWFLFERRKNPNETQTQTQSGKSICAVNGSRSQRTKANKFTYLYIWQCHVVACALPAHIIIFCTNMFSDWRIVMFLACLFDSSPSICDCFAHLLSVLQLFNVFIFYFFTSSAK